MRCIALTTLVLGATLRAAAQLVDPAKSAANIAQREDATASATHLNRFNGHVFVLDFNAEVCVGEGAGRDIVAASLADFPFLGDQRMSLGVGEMTPCRVSRPHNHPPSTGYLHAISGSNLEACFIRKNGAKFVISDLYSGHVAIFLEGSFRFQANLDCETVNSVADLDSTDPGAAAVPYPFLGIPPDTADVTLGETGVDEVAWITESIKDPDTFILGIQSCLDKIEPGRQPEDLQQQLIHHDSPDSRGNGTGDNETDCEDAPDDRVGKYNNPRLRPSLNDEYGSHWGYDKRDEGEPGNGQEQGTNNPTQNDQGTPDGSGNGQEQGANGPTQNDQGQPGGNGQEQGTNDPTQNGQGPPDSNGNSQDQGTNNPTQNGQGQPDGSSQEQGTNDPTQNGQGPPDSNGNSQEQGTNDPTQNGQGQPDGDGQGQGTNNPTQNGQGQPDGSSQGQGTNDPTQNSQGPPDGNGNSQEQGTNDPTQNDQGQPGGNGQEQGTNDPTQNGQGQPRGDGQEQGTDDPTQNGQGQPGNVRKRSETAEDPATPTSTTSTKVQTLEELVFFLKLILCVLLSGYVFILTYFIVPIWRYRRLQVEPQNHTVTPPSVPVQYFKV